MNAMSTRSVSSTRRACSPTAACVTPRTRPPSSCSDTDGIAASRAATGTELVTTTSSRSAGNWAAMRAVVVPASSSTLAPPRGRTRWRPRRWRPCVRRGWSRVHRRRARRGAAHGPARRRRVPAAGRPPCPARRGRAAPSRW